MTRVEDEGLRAALVRLIHNADRFEVDTLRIEDVQEALTATPTQGDHLMTSYDRLPEAMREGARDYVERHREPGGFLMAVLSNDLTLAFGRADEENRLFMAEWAMWLWNDIPAACWGSKAKVLAWLAQEDPVAAFDAEKRQEAEAYLRTHGR